MGPTRPAVKQDKSTATRDKNYKLAPGELVSLQGELFKIGRRTEKMIARHFELKDSCLIIFKDSTSLIPIGRYFSSLTHFLIRCYILEWAICRATLPQGDTWVPHFS